MQHQDGHSHIQAGLIPNCVSYDPCFAYELAVIIQDGMRRMYKKQHNVFYYITVMNENYSHPAMPKGCEEGIIKGMYLLQKASGKGSKVQLLGSGTILREVIAAAELLKKDFKVNADIWSVTSFNELRRDGLEAEHWNRFHPEEPQRECYLQTCLKDQPGPVVAATDYIKLYADQIRSFVSQPYTVLGTDGFGRSDVRAQLRKFFEVDRYHIVMAALKALADQGDVPTSKVTDAMKKYGIDAEKAFPPYA